MQIETQRELREYLASITPIETWKTQNYIKDEAIIHNFWELCQNVNHIKIVGDYDVDGICSTYILYKSLKERFPEKDISFRLPKRIVEGYGISKPIITEINEEFSNDKENSLIITVDNGISSGHYLDTIVDEGYKVCVLDHHQLADGVNLPKVTLSIDPAVDRLSNPFHGNYWCATGVAYLIVKDAITPELKKELETFAGIATVADCMELTEGNWVLVKNAIKNIRTNDFPDSLKHLLKELKKHYSDCTEDTFGYYLGPCFNACSRLYDAADKVLNYLINPSLEEAYAIKKINDERKELSNAFTELAVNKVKELQKENDYPLWLFYPDMPEGIVGIIAGHLSETFKTPVILLTNTEMEDEKGNNVYKGSARSYGDFNIYDYLYANREKLFKFGGHKGAAGLAVSEIFYDELSHIEAERIESTETSDEMVITIGPEDIPSYLNILEAYRPFGQGRLLPTFEMNINLQEQRDLKKSYIGSAEEHLCLTGPFGRYKILHFYHNIDIDKNKFYIKGKLSSSTFRGITTPNLVVDICTDEKEKEPAYQESQQR